jgi:protoheme IX farnesyltransferase
LRAYSQLSKNKLSIFVTGTAALGFLTAGPPVSVPALLGVTLGTYLCSAAAGTCNQIYEIRNDSVMNRTRARPLPTGLLSPAHATAFAATTAIAGVSLLATACNPLTAALGAANIVLYAGVYTPMKQVSHLNTELGAIVGAIPPLMGWAACTGSITADPAGIALFGALFLWQMPHFYALAWRHREDYARGGYQMISLGDHGGQRTANRTMAYSLGLAAFPLATTMAGVTGPMFIVEATIANAIFLYKARQFQQDPSDRNARGVFLNSLWYLPFIMVFLAFHSHRWKRATDQEEARRLSVAMPVVDASSQERSQEESAGSADLPLPQWLEEVDVNLAVAFADDPASKFVSNALSGAAAKARRIMRAHCPHELLVALGPERRDAPAAEASVSSAMAAAAGQAACPVTNQSHASVMPRAVTDSSDASNELATAIQASAVPSMSCPATTAPDRSGKST